MVAAIGAVAAVGSAAISASAAGDAADSQSQAAQQASAQQAMAAAQMRADLQPWVDTGKAANNRLSQYLGLGLGTSGTINGMQSGLTRDQVRQQLLSQYTTQVMTPQGTASLTSDPNYQRSLQMGMSEAEAKIYAEQARASQQAAAGTGNSYQTDPGGQSSGGGAPNLYADQIDEDGLNAAIQKYYDDQAAQEEALKNDPNYGSLLRAFHNGAEFDSGPAFSFTGEDLKTDPGYQFGLDQGTQGIDRGQAARGNYLSGAAMKELTRFNEDYAGTKFNEGFNRASATYGTNLARRQNEWNTNLGAYNQNRNTIYNFLTGQSTMGQNSAAQVGTNNQQTANSMANNTMSAGAAQAAGQVAGANSLMSGINTAANGINSAGGWNSLLSNNNSVYKPGGTASTGFGSGAGFGNQDMGQYL